MVLSWIEQKRWFQEHPMTVFDSFEGKSRKRELLVYTIAPGVNFEHKLVRYNETQFTPEALILIRAQIKRE